MAFLVYFLGHLLNFPHSVGILCQEKCGNPITNPEKNRFSRICDVKIIVLYSLGTRSQCYEDYF
jgi:hypothetical protein